MWDHPPGIIPTVMPTCKQEGQCKVLLNHTLLERLVEGDMGGGGYPIQQYRNKNWQIPKYRVDRRNTDTAFMIGTTIEKDALPISS